MALITKPGLRNGEPLAEKAKDLLHGQLQFSSLRLEELRQGLVYAPSWAALQCLSLCETLCGGL